MIFEFEPILKTLIWGTESWEISAVKGNETRVKGGNENLSELLARMQEQLVGAENWQTYGAEFPLLIKFIDAKQDLSIQVHPTDEIAKRQGRERGKTEMWYLMDAAPGAKLYSGLKKQITPEQYAAMVENDTICDALAQYEVKPGDVFFLPAGRIHAIGGGCYLAEIQQTSDVTWRIYDYGRLGADGKPRELHTAQAAEAIDYHVEPNYRTEYQPVINEGVEVVRCPYFTTAVYELTEPMQLDYSELDSFVVLMGLEGSGTITDSEGNTIPFGKGQTVLIPACESGVKISGSLKFIETYA